MFLFHSRYTEFWNQKLENSIQICNFCKNDKNVEIIVRVVYRFPSFGLHISSQCVLSLVKKYTMLYI